MWGVSLTITFCHPLETDRTRRRSTVRQSPAPSLCCSRPAALPFVRWTNSTLHPSRRPWRAAAVRICLAEAAAEALFTDRISVNVATVPAAFLRNGPFNNNRYPPPQPYKWFPPLPQDSPFDSFSENSCRVFYFGEREKKGKKKRTARRTFRVFFCRPIVISIVGIPSSSISGLCSSGYTSWTLLKKKRKKFISFLFRAKYFPALFFSKNKIILLTPKIFLLWSTQAYFFFLFSSVIFLFCFLLVERLSEESLFETRDTQHWNLVKNKQQIILLNSGRPCCYWLLFFFT